MKIIEEAEKLRAEGFALTRISQGAKNPSDKKWPLKSMEPEDFQGDYSLAIMGGPLSGGLIILDLDDNRILEPCREIMPHTDMKDGRKGREEAHWFYRVQCDHWNDRELPSDDSLTGAAMRRGEYSPFLGSRRIAGSDGKKFDVIGAGAQVVTAPSMHKSGFRREWTGGHRGEPVIVEWSHLKKCLNDLSLEIGWKPRPEIENHQKCIKVYADEPKRYRAQKYLESCTGGRGDDSGGGDCLKVCGAIAVGFGLGFEAFPLLKRWSLGLDNPYQDRDINRAIKKAINSSNRPMGYLLEKVS